MAVVTFSLRTLEEDRKGLIALLENAEHPTWKSALLACGLLLTATSQKAFDDQRLGDIEWPARYPNQKSEPYVNVAGVVADLGRGSEIADRRFENRPAGRDTGNLMNSVEPGRANVDITGFNVSVKSDVDYADRFHGGGISTLLIDDQVREGLAEHLKKHPEHRDRLGWLFHSSTTDVLETDVHPRPFLGVTDELKPKLIATIDHMLGGRPWEQLQPTKS